MPAAASPTPAADRASRLATTVHGKPRATSTARVCRSSAAGAAGRGLRGQRRPRLLELALRGQLPPDRVDDRRVQGGADLAVERRRCGVPLRRRRLVRLDGTDRRCLAGRGRGLQLALQGEEQAAREQQHPAERPDELRERLPDLLLLRWLNDLAHRRAELLPGRRERVTVQHAAALLVRQDEVGGAQREGLEQARDEGHARQQLGVDAGYDAGRLPLLDHRVDREAGPQVARHGPPVPGGASPTPGVGVAIARDWRGTCCCPTSCSVAPPAPSCCCRLPTSCSAKSCCSWSSPPRCCWPCRRW